MSALDDLLKNLQELNDAWDAETASLAGLAEMELADLRNALRVTRTMSVPPTKEQQDALALLRRFSGEDS